MILGLSRGLLGGILELRDVIWRPRWSQNGARIEGNAIALNPCAILAPSWPNLAPFWLHLGRCGTQSGTQMDPKSIILGCHFLIKFWNGFLKDLGFILAPILEVFGVPNRMKNEKAIYMKNCTAPRRQHTF